LARPSFDWNANIGTLLVWSAIEPGMGISAASLSTLRPLLRAFIRTFKSERSEGSNSRPISWLSRAPRGRIFAFSTGSRRTEESGSYLGTIETIQARMATKKSSVAKTKDLNFQPLDTSEAPDFLDVTINGSNPDLLSARGFVRYNATPRLPSDV
jgi:hypothetical protein